MKYFPLLILCLFATQTAEAQCKTIINKSAPYQDADTIFQMVIQADAYCCEVQWDATCQNSYKQIQLQLSVPTFSSKDTLCVTPNLKNGLPSLLVPMNNQDTIPSKPLPFSTNKRSGYTKVKLEY